MEDWNEVEIQILSSLMRIGTNSVRARGFNSQKYSLLISLDWETEFSKIRQWSTLKCRTTLNDNKRLSSDNTLLVGFVNRAKLQRFIKCIVN